MPYITPIPSESNGWMNWPNRSKDTVWHGLTRAEVGYLNAHLKYLSGQNTSPGNTYFSGNTYTAVRNYQAWWGLTVDGWVGPQTWSVLDWHTTL